MTWKPDQPYKPEWNKIVWELPQYTRGTGLDLGCGTGKAYPHFIGVDNHKDKELFGNPTVSDIKADVEKLPMFSDGSMDFVFSSHTLEHIENFNAALKEWWRVVKVGGNLVLYLPHKELYPNIGQPGANPDHKHDFLPEDIIGAMKDLGSWELLKSEVRGQDDEYSFLQVFRKLPKGGGHVYSHAKPKPEKSCAVVRYGAWGDALQASSVFPGLKEQGYHITLYTTPRAWEVLKFDPNIGAVYLQDTDQVPNAFLGQFWEHEKGKFDKWINLSEPVS